MRIMGRVVDDNCVAIMLILAFFLFIECVENFEGFADYPDSFGSSGDAKPSQPKMNRQALKEDPNMKPQQMKMDAPPSMAEEYAVLSGSPVKVDGDYLLLDPSLRSMASVSGTKPVSGQVVTDRPTAGKMDSVLSKQMMGVGHMDGLGKPPSMTQKMPGAPSKKGKYKEVRLIMLFAPWCGYSKKAKPDFDKMIENHHGQMKNGTMVKVLLYDTDKRKDMVEKYKVKGFPSYFLELEGHDGNVETKPVNERSYDKLEQTILSVV